MDDASDDTVTGEELRRWLDDGDDGPPPPATGVEGDRQRRRWWWLAAVAPWVLLAVAVAAAGSGSDAPPTTAGRPGQPGAAGVREGGTHDADADAGAGVAAATTAGSGTAAHVGAPSTAPAAAPSAASTSVPTAAPADRDGPGPPPAAPPVAIGLVRDAATTAGAGSTTAVDTASAGRVEPLGDGTWLVRVHAVVLRGDRRRWRSARHEVWAAPIGRRGGAVVALDRPWRVAVVDATPHPPRWSAAGGDVAAVRSALRDAGLPAGRDLRLQRDPTLPGVVRAVTGASSAWLRAGAQPRVLGTGAP
jgi:hypothetical protein